MNASIALPSRIFSCMSVLDSKYADYIAEAWKATDFDKKSIQMAREAAFSGAYCKSGHYLRGVGASPICVTFVLIQCATSQGW